MTSILIISDIPLLSVVIKDMAGQVYDQPCVDVCETINFPQSDLIDRRYDAVFFNLEGSLENQRDIIFRAVGEIKIGHMVIFSQQPHQSLGLGIGNVPTLKLNRHSSFTDILTEWSGFVTDNSPRTAALTGRSNRGRVYQSSIRHSTSTKPLTHKQVEVMELLIDGNSCKRIAQELGMSPDTVRGHLKEAYLRLQAKSRAQAVNNYLQAKAAVGAYHA